MDIYCAFCKNRFSNLRRCTKCLKVYYCSKTCQTRDWKSGHQKICKSYLIVDKDKNLPAEEDVCSVCPKKCKPWPLMCSKCHKVRYCSVECQKKDWPDHKLVCTSVNCSGPEPMSDPTRKRQAQDKGECVSSQDVCSVCCKKCKPMRCSKCHKVRYCSEECQKKDWPDHKLSCSSADSFGRTQLSGDTKKGQAQKNETKKKGPENKDLKSTLEPSNLPKQTCAVCGNSNCMKSCGRCKNVSYCSKACQQKDWPSHKSNCKSDVDDVITTDGYKQIQEEEKRTRENNFIMGFLHQDSMRPGLSMIHGFPPLFVNDGADLCMRKTATISSKQKAKFEAESEFPGQTVVDDFDEVPKEPWGTYLAAGKVLVTFINRYHPYRGRHCVYIEDIDGVELYVAFYFDYPPFPFFTWSSVRPGRFICIQEPCVHFFTDGSVGFRINSPKEVKFIDP